MKNKHAEKTLNTNQQGFIANNISELANADLDSVVIFQLMRKSISEYDRNLLIRGKLNKAETEKLLYYLTNKNNFYGGTPASFGFTAEIVFYSHGKNNRIKIAPDSYKVMQEDFDIPYNRVEIIKELGGAASFPFIKENFALFLKKLEEKYLE